MWKFYVADKAGAPIDVRCGLDECQTLITEGLRTLAAHWKSPSITTATTTTVVEAKPNQSIMLTDLVVILSKKVAGATVIVRFSDGTNTEIMLTFDAATANFEFTHAFTGGLRGWKDADFQIVTNQATTLAVIVGYVHISTESTKAYDVWDAER